jgi:hypothetical protein
LSYVLLTFAGATNEGSDGAQVVDSGYPRNQKGWIFPLSGYPALLFYKSLNKLSGNTGGIYLCAGIEDASDKENGTRFNVANQEDEGAVYGDFHRRFGYCC